MATHFQEKRGERIVEFGAAPTNLNKSCKCRAVMDEDKQLKDIVGEHTISCKKVTARESERNACRASIKRKAEDSLNCRPMKIIRKDLRASQYDNLQASDLHLIRRSLYRERKKLVPNLPRSQEETVAFLFAEQDHLLTNKGEKFVHVSKDGLIMLTTERNLELLGKCPIWLADGTFDRSLQFFLQLYTIHGYIDGHNVPLAYFPLPDKKETTYIKMFEFLAEKSPVTARRNLS